MKEIFLNNSMNLILSKYNYDNDTKDRLKYGLETIYITITKFTVIFGISIIFGLIKETLIFTLFITGLRSFAYGLHAKKSWHCYVSSIIVFILMPYIFINIKFNIMQKIIISVLTVLSLILFAPADTHKRPLVNKKHRIKLKCISIFICSIYIFIVFITKIEILNNLILLSMITEMLIINPILYKMFNLPYKNYKEYAKNGV